MSGIKNAMYNTILYQEEIENDVMDGSVSVELAREMLDAITKLEYELAVYRAGCSKDEVDEIMKNIFSMEV